MSASLVMLMIILSMILQRTLIISSKKIFQCLSNNQMKRNTDKCHEILQLIEFAPQINGLVSV